MRRIQQNRPPDNPKQTSRLRAYSQAFGLAIDWISAAHWERRGKRVQRAAYRLAELFGGRPIYYVVALWSLISFDTTLRMGGLL